MDQIKHIAQEAKAAVTSCTTGSHAGAVDGATTGSGATAGGGLQGGLNKFGQQVQTDVIRDARQYADSTGVGKYIPAGALGGPSGAAAGHAGAGSTGVGGLVGNLLGNHGAQPAGTSLPGATGGLGNVAQSATSPTAGGTTAL